MSANYELRGDVAVITMDNPPVNGLGYDTRRGIVDGLDRALADAKVKAIVVTGAGKAFSGGADIREFGSPKAIAEPNLLSVIAALEASPKPIVAAVHSVAMGGGLELALGCHYRVAAAGAQIALPEVKIGLIPGAGGTQRLPRVLGVETALNMIVSGEPVKSELLAKLPGQKLFDKIVEGDVVDAAVAFAREKADARPLPIVSKLKVEYPNADAYFQFARNTVGAMSKNFPAPLKCVDAVAASVKMKFEDGMKLEREIFMALMLTPESKALRHAFMAERATTKIPDVPADTPTRADQEGRRHRRRHDGRRHRHELPQRRHPGRDARDEAGSARQGRRHHAQELRGAGQEGQAQAGQARRAHGPAVDDAEVRRPERTPTSSSRRCSRTWPSRSRSSRRSTR